MNDTDTLHEHLWDAIFASRDKNGEEAPTDDVVNAVLAIVQPAIREAQAEALRDAAAEFRRGYAVSRPPVVVERFLRHRADNIERSTDA